MLADFLIMDFKFTVFLKMLYFGGIILAMTSCYKKKELPEIPEISLVGLSKTIMKQGYAEEDSLEIYLRVLDGNGDLGYLGDSAESSSVFLVDSRTGNVAEQFSFPAIPEDKIPNGLDAELRILTYTTCCIYPGNLPPCSVQPQYPTDSFKYEIWLLDRAGNKSNVISTPFIRLECN